MSDVVSPMYVRQALLTLERAGYCGYLVGGCVRDALMGRRPKDWDVCTDARPDEVLSCFPRAITVGQRHGTVTAVIGKRRVEITTFRSEGAYSDRRRPDSVDFIADLNADLSRRDFTMNAVAVSLSGRLADPFSGRADIGGRLIRCVGDPVERFEEDALRMLRALRFSAQLGFDIDRAASDSLYACAPLCASLAPERVSAELEKILMSPSPCALGALIGFGLLDSYLDAPRAAADFSRIKRLPKKRLPRWAAFCCALARGGLISDARDFLLSLRLDTDTVKGCCAGVSAALGGLPGSEADWKRLLAECGPDAAYCAAACDAQRPERRLAELRAVLASGECWSVKRLAVTGGDLLSLGYEGRQIGKTLGEFLEYVIERPEMNERSCLLALLQNMPAKSE